MDAEVASHGYADKSDIVALLNEHAYVFSDEEGVKQLAEAVWYRGYCSVQAELERLRDVMPREEFQRTLCVLELLSQYPVCHRDTARHLQPLTRLFHRQLLGNDNTPAQG